MRKRAIITGASSGLGIEIANTLAANNIDLILTYLNNEKNCLRVKEEIINKYNVDVITHKLDLTNDNSIKDFVNSIDFNIDILINNAAISKDSLVEDKTREDFIEILDTNLVGPFLLTREIVKKMNKNSTILNVSSTNGIDTYYSYSLDYDASKAGLINLTHNMANMYAPIRVNAICPGWIDNNTLDENFKNNEINKILLKRFASEKEIANVIYFLVSDNASYINDSIIRADGGKC